MCMQISLHTLSNIFNTELKLKTLMKDQKLIFLLMKSLKILEDVLNRAIKWSRICSATILDCKNIFLRKELSCLLYLHGTCRLMLNMSNSSS